MFEALLTTIIGVATGSIILMILCLVFMAFTSLATYEKARVLIGNIISTVDGLVRWST